MSQRCRVHVSVTIATAIQGTCSNDMDLACPHFILTARQSPSPTHHLPSHKGIPVTWSCMHAVYMAYTEIFFISAVLLVNAHPGDLDMNEYQPATPEIIITQYPLSFFFFCNSCSIHTAIHAVTDLKITYNLIPLTSL